MKKIHWCLKIKKGLEITEPNINLSKAYLKKAEDSLEVLSEIKDESWKISVGYYVMYFSLYSILMKIGVKSENHSCTIEFMKKLLSEYFSEKEADFLDSSKNTRIDAQYHTKKIPVKQYKEITKRAPGFFIKCKETLNRLTEEEIKKIRKNLKQQNI